MKTKQVKAIVVGLMITAIPYIATAGTSTTTDVQVRIPLHVQYTDVISNKLGSFGMAGWIIFPNVTAEGNHTARTYIAGPMLKYGTKGSWIELMGGCRENDDGFIDSLINVRLVDKSISPRLITSCEFAYFPQQERRRFYTLLSLDTPIHLRSYTFFCGLESEDTISFTSAKDSFGIGPKITFPIPLEKLSKHLSSSLIFSYEKRTDRDFVRSYLVLTYKFSKN